MVETGEDVLIRRAREGDPDAFCQLARGYQRRIYSLALHFCRDPFDAEDLSQEVWLKAYRSLQTFRGGSSFYTWLRQITVNTFLNYRRGQSYTQDGERRPVRMEGLEAADGQGGFGPPGHVGFEEGFERQVLVGRVMHALAELTPQQRLMFLLKHREGMTYQEIASTFGCSAGSVKKSLFRAVLKLRESLGVGGERAECVAAAAEEV